MATVPAHNFLNRLWSVRPWLALAMSAAGAYSLLMLLRHGAGGYDLHYLEHNLEHRQYHSVTFWGLFCHVSRHLPAVFWPIWVAVLALFLTTVAAAISGGQVITRIARLLSAVFLFVVASGLVIQVHGNWGAEPASCWYSVFFWLISGAWPSAELTFHSGWFESMVASGFSLVALAAWVSPMRRCAEPLESPPVAPLPARAKLAIPASTTDFSRAPNQPQAGRNTGLRRWSRLAVASALVSLLYGVILLLLAHETVVMHLAPRPGWSAFGAFLVYSLAMVVTLIATLITLPLAGFLAKLAWQRAGSSGGRLRGRGLVAGTMSLHTILAVIFLAYFAHVWAQNLRIAKAADAQWAKARAKAEAPIRVAQAHMRMLLNLLRRYANTHGGRLPVNLAVIAGPSVPDWLNVKDYRFPAAGLPIEKLPIGHTKWRETGLFILLVDRTHASADAIVLGVVDRDGEWVPRTCSIGEYEGDLLQMDGTWRAALHWPSAAHEARQHVRSLLGILQRYSVAHGGRLPSDLRVAIGSPAPRWFRAKDYDFLAGNMPVGDLPARRGRRRTAGLIILIVDRRRFVDGSLVLGIINAGGRWVVRQTRTYNGIYGLFSEDQRTLADLRLRPPAVNLERIDPW